MQPIVQLAKQVVSNADAYPPTVVNHAKGILESYETHRDYMAALWVRRNMLHNWHKARKQSKRTHPEQQSVYHSRAAGRWVAAHYQAHDVELFHKGKSRLRKFHSGLGLLPLIFESAVKLVHEPRVGLVLSYWEHVSAQRKDEADVLGSVAYLRMVGGPLSAEIMAWRLLNNKGAK